MIFGLLGVLFWPALVVVFIARKWSGWSQEKSLSEIFFVWSVLFFGVTVYAISRDYGDLIRIPTIISMVSIASFVIAYRYNSLSSLVLGTVSVMAWWIGEYKYIAETYDLQMSPVLLGLVSVLSIFYMFGRLHEKVSKNENFSDAYILIGILGVSGVLLFASVQDGLRLLDDYSNMKTPFSTWQSVVMISSVLIAYVVALGVTIKKNAISFYEAFSLSLILIVFFVFMIMPGKYLLQDVGARSLTGFGIVWAAIFNVMIFLEVLGVILLGFVRRESLYVNIGAVFMFVLIFIKYFDWFFTFLDKSVFFIVAGILLFGVGFGMERARKYMLTNLKENKHSFSNT